LRVNADLPVFPARVAEDEASTEDTELDVLHVIDDDQAVFPDLKDAVVSEADHRA